MKYKPQDVKDEYADMAPSYDQGSLDCEWSAPTFVKDDLTRRGLLKPNAQIVDFATGTGLLSESFRSTASGETLNITALDLSPDMLEKTRAKNIANVLQEQDITQPWKVAKQSFDIAAATGVGEYLTDEQLSETVQQSVQALKSGGYLAFTYRPEDDSGDNQKLHNPKTVENIFNEAGFKIITHDSFEAYKSDNGEVMSHKYILAQLL